MVTNLKPNCDFCNARIVTSFVAYQHGLLSGFSFFPGGHIPGALPLPPAYPRAATPRNPPPPKKKHYPIHNCAFVQVELLTFSPPHKNTAQLPQCLVFNGQTLAATELVPATP